MKNQTNGRCPQLHFTQNILPFPRRLAANITRKHAAVCRKISTKEENVLQFAGRFLPVKKVSCSLQEGFYKARKSPAVCRKVSAKQENVLQSAGKNHACWTGS